MAGSDAVDKLHMNDFTERGGTISQILLDCGSNADAQDKGGETAIMKAAHAGNSQVVSTLLRSGASIDILDFSSRTVLMHAAYGGNLNIARLLRQTCVAHVNAKDKGGQSPMITAVEKGNLDFIKLLCNQGAFVDVPNVKGETALMIAAANGHVKVVQFLLAQKASVHFKTKDQWTPLMYAADSGWSQNVRILLEHGAAVDATETQLWTALMLAASKGHAMTVRVLMHHGASLDKVNEDTRSASILAASNGHVNCVRTLKWRGASINIKDKEGRSALMLAFKQGHRDVARELLLDDNAMDDAMSLFQYGLRQREMNLDAETHEEAITLSDVKEVVAGMLEARLMFDRIHTRLVDVETQLKAKPPHMKSLKEANRQHKQNVKHIHSFLIKRVNNRIILRLVSNHQTMQSCKDIHDQLDQFMKDHSLLPHSVHHWNDHWDEDTRVHEAFFRDSLQQLNTNPDLLKSELLDTQPQSETLTLLMFECNNLNSLYTKQETDLIRLVFENARRLSALGISAIPELFVPPRQVESTHNLLGAGSYSYVHRGSWNVVEVAIKMCLWVIPRAAIRSGRRRSFGTSWFI